MYILLVLVILVSGSDGQLSDWTHWSSCPASGEGSQSRERTNTTIETKACRKIVNLALGKEAKQSSIAGDEEAEYAVDGNLKTYSMTFTNIAWWRVDMEKTAIINKVRMYPFDSYDVTNTNVTIGTDVAEMTSCGVFNITGGKQRRRGYLAYDVICEKPLLGRYIQVNNNYGDSNFAIREFEAYGRYIKLENVALGGGANQSSTYPDIESEAANAIDGNLVTYSCTNTQIAWWRVQLRIPATIYKVRLYPGNIDDVTNTIVTIGNHGNISRMTSCGTFNVDGGIKRRAGYYAYDVTCEKPLVGKYIQLNNNCENSDFEIREFEAYGQYV